MIQIKDEPVMGIETTRHDHRVSDIHDAPSISPHDDHAVDHPSSAAERRMKPQFHAAVSPPSPVGSSRMSVMDVAKSVVSTVGLVAGFGVYVVVILSVIAASLCWMPFSRSDGA